MTLLVSRLRLQLASTLFLRVQTRMNEFSNEIANSFQQHGKVSASVVPRR